MRILGISGSLRAVSSNTRALQAAQLLAPEGMEVVLYSDLGALPHFNPDLDAEPLPALIQALRLEIGRCDGVLICSPEYAHGIVGSLKNALDWLVSSLEFPDTPVAMINTSPRTSHANAQLLEILTTMSARVIEEASITLPLLGRQLDADAIAEDDVLADKLGGALRAFKRAIEVG